MAQFPEHVLTIARDAARRHPNDIPAAVTEFVNAIGELDDFDDLVPLMIAHAGQALIHDCRHSSNGTIKRRQPSTSGSTLPGGARVNPTTVQGAQPTWRAMYSIMLAGKALGDITLGELPTIRDNIKEQVIGHTKDLKLVEGLIAMGDKNKRPPTTTVRRAFQERWISDLWTCIEEEMRVE